MANHGFGYLDHETSIKEIFLYADLCNVERFGGVLDVILNGDYVLVNSPDKTTCYFECWLTSRRDLEFRHGNRSSLDWYLDNYFAAFIINELGGKIGDDGHEEIIKPDYCVRFPTFKSWFEMRYPPSRSLISKVIGKIIAPSLYRLAKDEAGEKLWAVL